MATEITAFYEREIFGASNYLVLYCSTDDESASLVPQNIRNAKKGRYGFTAVLKNLIIAEAFDKTKRYKLIGEWTLSSYGKQFNVTDFEVIIGKTKPEILDFLVSIDEIGPITARKIYNYFKEDTVDIFKNKIEKIKEIPSISDKKFQKIKDSYEKKIKYREVLEYLSRFSLSTRKIKAVYDKYGDLSRDIISENPFMVSDSNAISFIEANSIAIDLEINLKSDIRIKQAVIYIIQNVFKVRGHLFCNIKGLAYQTSLFLNKNVSKEYFLSEDEVKAEISEMIARKELIKFNDYVYLIKDCFAEKKSAQLIIDMIHNKYDLFNLTEEKCKDAITACEKKFGIVLNQNQKEAIACSLGNNVSIITGGPGTGKTTLLKFILEIFKNNFGENIGLCSPTGKAARRMSESTGFGSACTIHNLLGIETDYQWSLENNNTIPVEYDLLVIDESSMLDQEILYLLVSSLPKKCKLIFIGDVDQLPSVGAGNVLKEMIASGVVPTTKLTQIYRQSEQSKIVLNAYKLNNGKTDFDLSSKDFCVVKRGDDINEKIANYYVNFIKSGRYGINDIQILTPYRSEKYPASTYYLNKIIQEKYNPPNMSKREFKVGKCIFRVGDKVIQQKNTEDIKNGDTGIVISIGADTETGCMLVEIDFGEKTVFYSKEQLEETRMDLAYALTVHKSQGSEYKLVIMPSIEEHKNMLTRKLVYTAWTRAKEHVLIVGDIEYMKEAANNTAESVRNTVFSKRLQARNKKYR